jgi:hypothetical protein
VILGNFIPVLTLWVEVPRAERLAMVERKGSEPTLKAQAELLGLNRSSLYYQPLPPSPEEIAVKQLLRLPAQLRQSVLARRAQARAGRPLPA